MSNAKTNTSKKLKTAKGRKLSSTKWLQRHISDQYVNMASAQGYRSRAAFKLIDIEKQFHLIKKSKIILDLGSAPGSWLQVLRNFAHNDSKIIGVDLKEIDEIKGVHFLKGDFCDPIIQASIKEQLDDKKANLILSDMAPKSCGNNQLDHLRIISLAKTAYEFSKNFLKDNGNFVMKIIQGGKEKDLVLEMQKEFNKVKFFKPKASYSTSSEIFIVALDKKKVS